ncbi:MAG: hypothetical protein ABEI58_00100 [Candidatus Nanohaloarchaea archaeon]
MRREKIAGIAFLLLMTFFVCGAVWNSTRGERVSFTFLGFLLGWSSYLAAHYFFTGKLVHVEYEEEDLADLRSRVYLVAGAALTLTGVSAAVYHLNQGGFPAFLASGVLVTAGYIIYHKSLYGKML